MQVVCGSCQLNFQAPDGATGLLCPICRSPLRPAQASAAAEAAAQKTVQEWAGGTLDDLIAIASPPALALRVEVLPAKGDTPVGEVHLLAGGVSEAIYGGSSTEDALDKLRAVSNARFRIEPRLPNPTDGDLTYPGPDTGTLDARPLAHLMRYCEQYVITCGIEVWRGSENARVEYRKGEISGVTVGGIDAPERLAEVMQWSSGNYRLMVPRLTLPAVAPPRAASTAAPSRPSATPAAARPTPSAAQAAAPVSAAAAAAAAASSSQASRTIFGMPALDAAAMKGVEAGAAAAKAAAAAPASVIAPPGVAASMPVPAPVPAQERASATKTIFGVPAPKVPDVVPVPEKSPEDSGRSGRATAATSAPDSGPSKVDRKIGARKTIVPGPEIIAPPAGMQPAPAMAAASSAPAASVSAASASATDVSRTTQEGYGSQSANTPEMVVPRTASIDDRTQPVRVGNAKPARGTPVWTYVGVGFLFGLALLGIYQLVGVLAH
jgi:hypothetical protein